MQDIIQKPKHALPPSPNGALVIQVPKVHKALGWFPEIQRDAFCMRDPADHSSGGPYSSEDIAAKSPERVGRPVFWFALGLIHSRMAVMLLSCLKTCKNFPGLVKSHLNSYHGLLDPAWSDPHLHSRPLTHSPTKQPSSTLGNLARATPRIWSAPLLPRP